MIYLASKSPRSAELLKKINVEFLLLEAEIEENPDFMNEDLQKKKEAIEKRAQMILSQIDSARIQMGESE